MRKLAFYCNRNSMGLKALIKVLREKEVPCIRIKRKNSRYNYNLENPIVNWGSSRMGTESGCIVLNQPGCISNASAKLECFRYLNLNNVPILSYTSERAEAEGWIENDEVVYCRTLTRSSQGKGIIIASTLEELVDAPLYTKRLDYTREFRVHVFQGEVIDYTQKRKMSTETLEERGITLNTEVRSHNNGWVFARDGVELPESAKEVAIAGVEALGLDFGAVDIAVVDAQDNAYIIEINTAPGLTGTTLERYSEALKGYFGVL